jgi:hypothetical protein
MRLKGFGLSTLRDFWKAYWPKGLAENAFTGHGCRRVDLVDVAGEKLTIDKDIDGAWGLVEFDLRSAGGGCCENECRKSEDR